MRENLLNRKDNNFRAAEKYALKYFNDLQKHFSHPLPSFFGT